MLVSPYQHMLLKPLDTSIVTVPEAWNCSTSSLSGTMSFLPGNVDTGDDVVIVGGDAVAMVMDDSMNNDDDVVTTMSSHSMSSSSSDMKLSVAPPETKRVCGRSGTSLDC